jgi:hypothetical protein
VTLVSVITLVATFVPNGWIEAVFGVEPDGGIGSLELGLAAAAIVWLSYAIRGRAARRRATAAPARTSSIFDAA